jgi:Leucine-rich repeat (LRR) protein
MMATTIGQFVLLLMAYNVQTIICSSLYGNETDWLSLLEFKKGVNLDPQQVLMSWNDSTHFCHWEGVLCGMKTRPRVISLNLTNRGLVGQISPSVGNLTFLQFLILPTNSFSGEIPPSIGRLHYLRTIYLTNNTLQGKIPNFSNCTNLKVLQLDSNNLVGKFPNLPTHLRELHLYQNNLTGTIPSSLANITTLRKLVFVLNNLEGNIPNDFAKLRKLQFLYGGGNKLTGMFPHAVLNLSALSGLSLAFNSLSGEVPSNLGNHLPDLQMLGLAANFFHGHIPHSLINASNLYNIDISSNTFTGVIHSSIGELSKLSYLNLEFNQFQARNEQEWEFMRSLSNCTELQIFSMKGNRLEGHVPNSLANLSDQLQHLFLGTNKLSGGFPSGIANLPGLFSLGLEENQFTGVVPEWLGTLHNLQGIELANNFFTGVIPSSLANLSQLAELFIESNNFYGNIPQSLGNLKVLEKLSISNNNLNGSIPKEIFSIPAIIRIGLSFNKLDGPLPMEIGHAKQLLYLLISSNNIFGVIPETLDGCESMEVIEFDHNSLSGRIPTSLGNMSNLQVLNMSHNHLSGSIPKSIGTLQYLQQLDLSFNRLDGEVPQKGVFKNTTAIRIGGNHGLCSGVLELHLPACLVTTSSPSKHNRPLYFKVMIPLASMVLLASLISMLLFWRKKQRSKSISLPSSGRKFPKVSYDDIAKATEGFSLSNLIGSGRYSNVYKAKLFREENVVAVKVFRLETRGAQKSFITECNALRNVRHRNLVRILTACSSIDTRGIDFKALVFEFMPRGDLHKLLHSAQDDQNSSNMNRISLAQRLSIVTDVSDAVAYLHHNHQGSIVHCDLKPSNILLDDDMVAHVGDFGLARLPIHTTSTSSFGDSTSTSSIAIKGTIGYVAPGIAHLCIVFSFR